MALLALWITPLAALADDGAEMVALRDRVQQLFGASRFAEAAPLAERLSKLCDKVFGPMNPDTADSLNNLAVIYQFLGDNAKARPPMERALTIKEKALGPNDPGTAECLNNMAKLYQEMGLNAKAEPMYRRALAIREKSLGRKRPETATTLYNLGMLYTVTASYTKALPMLEEALSIRERALGPENPETATSLTGLAVYYQSTSDPAKADPLYRRAYAIYEKALGPNHIFTITGRNNLALNYQVLGDYAKAQPLLEQALKDNEKALGPQHPNTAISLVNLAELYKSEGDYQKAEPLFKRALDVREKALGANHPDTAQSLNNLAGFYMTMGDYHRAKPLYERALSIDESVLGPRHPTTATNLSNLALVYADMGDAAKAEPLYRRALEVAEGALGPWHADVALNLDKLAMLYEDMGNYAKAAPLLTRALAIREKAFGPWHPSFAESLSSLSRLYADTGDFKKALPLCERALAVREKALGSRHPDTSESLGNLAEDYESLGEYAKAAPLLAKALAIRETAFGPQHPRTGVTLSNLAHLYENMGESAKAEPLYARAVEISEEALGSSHLQTITSVDNLGYFKIAQGKTGDAVKLLRKSVQAKDERLENILSFTSERERLSFQESVNLFSLACTLGSAPDIAAVVLHQKGVVLDSLLEDRLMAEASRDPARSQVIEQIRAARQRLTQLEVAPTKDDSPETLRRRNRERDAAVKELEGFEAGMARDVAGLGRARRALSVTVGQVQSSLTGDQALVEFVRYNHYLGVRKWEFRFGALLLAASGEPRWIPLGSAAEIEEGLQRFGHSFQGGASGATDESFSTRLRALYDQVWAPIEKTMPPSIKTIILCPDGELNFLSFATLIAPDQSLLAEKYSIRYVASSRDLLREVKPSPTQQMALFGNPDFKARVELMAKLPLAANGLPSRSPLVRDFVIGPLAALPGTASECEALEKEAAQYGLEAHVFLGAEANENQLRRVTSPRILHLATHGFFLPEPKKPPTETSAASQRTGAPDGTRPRRVLLTNPMHRSGLALAGAQRTFDAWAKGEAPPGENDGVVTAEEVGGLSLRGTWLVTLSACETGVGEARSGEGVLGLRRGFIQAGVQNLLMTLWAISDDTTVEIMKDFYARALKTGNASQALADTQREWLVKLRKEKGLAEAVTLAGPFIMSSQGKP